MTILYKSTQNYDCEAYKVQITSKRVLILINKQLRRIEYSFAYSLHYRKQKYNTFRLMLHIIL